MEQTLLFYIIFMTVYIGILMKFLENGFLGTLGKRSHVKLLGYAHWLMSIRISHMKDHYIPVDKARYATSVVAKYLDTAIVKEITRFYKTTFPYDIIFTKSDAYTIDEQV